MRKYLIFFLIFFISFSLFSVDLGEFYNLLIELPDWKAEEPLGGKINIDQIYTLRIEKKYSNDKASFKVVIMGGAGVEVLWEPFKMDLSYDNDSEWRKTEDIEGFKIGIFFNKNSKSGKIIIPFKKNKNKIVGAIIMEFKKMPYKKAISILKNFDWKGIEELLIKDMKTDKKVENKK